MFTHSQIGLLGIGSIGSLITSLLYNRYQITAYNRSLRQSVLIRNLEGLRELNITCYTEPESVPLLPDNLIICLKEHQFEHAQLWFEKLIHKSSLVVVIRNGLQHKEPLLNYTKPENIVECLVDCPVQKDANDVYHQLKKPLFTLADTPQSKKFANWFSEDSAHFNFTNDFKTESWKKLCESASLGAILSLSLQPSSIFKEDPGSLSIYRKILKECMDVAGADGAQIPDNFMDQMLKKVMGYPPEKGSSMLTDRLNGAPIELGAKNGIVAETGRKKGVPTPLNDKVCDLLKKADRNTGLLQSLLN